MSNVGLWDEHWSWLNAPMQLGGNDGYHLAAEWVKGEPLVEDWGCGPGGLRSYVLHSSYRGVDGSASPFADVHADLVQYRPTDRPAIVMRGVLEHNDLWRAVLDNALQCFGDRMAIGLFTPLLPATTVLLREPDYGNVPVIGFRLQDLTLRIEAARCSWSVETFASPDTAYGHESIIRVAR